VARILVIDDDPLVRFTLRQVLGRATAGQPAHAIVEAADADAGIAAAREAPFDLAMIDMIMPERSGLDAVLEIRACRPGVLVIAMSGGTRTDNSSILAAAQRLGVAAVLRKPFTARELRSAVDRVLDAPPTAE
jgi:DNA-binding NarL/FixJ family response regulator